MTFLVFAACLALQPEECRERKIRVYGKGETISCMMTAQLTLAQWANDHSEWRIRKWHCATDPPVIGTVMTGKGQYSAPISD
ncbi:hypothetical protein [Paracoccus aestuariivivens]|uniref:Uncharacterized protein n=1 Tax=Paracoccus aestuariivivens TaxID=1820333 RepID=A0A6L6JB76_9RHOB|nr:hypothetical protein [Paracoccus aestuariivivens]MTH79240.1 hypothetical protein [Paracoccus aestuariivivens]